MSHTIPFSASFALAQKYHKGQKDKAGIDYIAHVMRVAMTARVRFGRLVDMGVISQEQADNGVHVAILHDIVEDTDITEKTLQNLGYHQDVVSGVMRLTGRPENITYLDNIRNMVLEGNIIPIVAKMCDNEDNKRPDRHQAAIDAGYPGHPAKKRYDVSFDILQKGLEGIVVNHSLRVLAHSHNNINYKDTKD